MAGRVLLVSLAVISHVGIAEAATTKGHTLVASKTECSEASSNEASVQACASKCTSEYFVFGRQSGRCSGSTCRCTCLCHPQDVLYHKLNPKRKGKASSAIQADLVMCDTLEEAAPERWSKRIGSERQLLGGRIRRIKKIKRKPTAKPWRTTSSEKAILGKVSGLKQGQRQSSPGLRTFTPCMYIPELLSKTMSK